MTSALLLLTTFTISAAPATDTLHFSCDAAPTAMPTAAAAGRYVIRNQLGDGDAFESSDHSIAFRDSADAGRPLLIWQGEWRHRRDRFASEEVVVLCRNGLAPLMLRIGGRSGTRTVSFNGRVAEWRGPGAPARVDTLPEVAFPRESQHLLAALLAAGGARIVFAPIYRSESDAPAGRFEYATIQVRPAAQNITAVHITAFGGTLEYEVDTAAQQVKIVRLVLTMGVIEEVRQ